MTKEIISLLKLAGVTAAIFLTDPLRLCWSLTNKPHAYDVGEATNIGRVSFL